MGFVVHPARILISGPSGSGKSHLVARILADLDDVFDKKIEGVTVCFTRNQSLYADMVSKCKVPVKMVKGLPENLNIPKKHLLVLDDLMGDGYQKISDIFTKDSHHGDFSVIYIVQSLFNKNPFHRVISLNAQYLVLLPNPRDKSQISHLARQLSPNNPSFVIDAYFKSTSENFGYLLIDCRPDTNEELRLRDSIFSGAGVWGEIKGAHRVSI